MDFAGEVPTAVDARVFALPGLAAGLLGQRADRRSGALGEVEQHDLLAVAEELDAHIHIRRAGRHVVGGMAASGVA